MLQTWRIRKGDRVVITTGKDRGKRGEVTEVCRKVDKVIVKGVNVLKRHQRPTASHAGGIVHKEAPIHVSNVMIADPKNDQPTRVGIKITQEGRKVRYAKRSGEIIDK
jgi:large subunit ribosomal protein L24